MLYYIMHPYSKNIVKNDRLVKQYMKHVTEDLEGVPFYTPRLLSGLLKDDNPNDRRKIMTLCKSAIEASDRYVLCGFELSEGVIEELKIISKANKFPLLRKLVDREPVTVLNPYLKGTKKKDLTNELKNLGIRNIELKTYEI